MNDKIGNVSFSIKHPVAGYYPIHGGDRKGDLAVEAWEEEYDGDLANVCVYLDEYFSDDEDLLRGETEASLWLTLKPEQAKELIKKIEWAINLIEKQGDYE